MKSTFLVSFLRGSFHFLEWICAAGVCLVLVQAWIITPIETSTPGANPIAPLYGFYFDLTPSFQPLVYNGNPGDRIRMDNLSARVEVSEASRGSPLLGFLRWEATGTALRLILFLAIFGLLRRLFDNVRRGDAFSSKSVRYVRLIGLFCLGYAAVYSGFYTWLNYAIGEHLRHYVVAQGIQTSFYSASGDAISFSRGGSQIVLDLVSVSLGLLALAFAEVFRQGLSLRQENELTV